MEVKVWPVEVVTVVWEDVSVILETGVERWRVPVLRRAARPWERDCVPITRQLSVMMVKETTHLF